MAKLCPSSLCNHENPDQRFVCGKCGMDLDKDRTETKGRDILFEVFKELGEITTLKPELKEHLDKMTREDFDRAIEKRVGTVFMIMLEMVAKENATKKMFKHSRNERN